MSLELTCKGVLAIKPCPLARGLCLSESSRPIGVKYSPLVAGVHSGWCVPEMRAQKCCLSPYQQGGKIARRICPSGSTGTAAAPGDAGCIVTVVGGRRELGDPV